MALETESSSGKIWGADRLILCTRSPLLGGCLVQEEARQGTGKGSGWVDYAPSGLGSLCTGVEGPTSHHAAEACKQTAWGVQHQGPHSPQGQAMWVRVGLCFCDGQATGSGRAEGLFTQPLAIWGFPGQSQLPWSPIACSSQEKGQVPGVSIWDPPGASPISHNSLRQNFYASCSAMPTSRPPCSVQPSHHRSGDAWVTLPTCLLVLGSLSSG